MSTAPLTVSSIAALESSILSSSLQSNGLLSLVSFIESPCKPNTLKAHQEALQTIHRIFSHFSSLTQFYLISPPDAPAPSAFATWLAQLFKRYTKTLWAFLRGEETSLALLASRALTAWMSIEYSQLCASRPQADPPALVGHYALASPSLMLATMMREILDMTNMSEQLRIEIFHNFFLKFDDLRLYGLKYFLKATEDEFTHKQLSEAGLIFLTAFSSVGSRITGNSFFYTDPAADKSVLKDRLHRTLSDCWLAYLRLKHGVPAYKAILGAMNDTIFPAVTSPLLLADFLSDSYRIGGVVSLLSLASIFTLISQYNLDYPQFYKKLYSLLEPRVFHVKYRTRFLHLMTKFLNSNYLPASLVSAFIKRFCRLALTAPPHGSMYLMTEVFNLLRKHPALSGLIHREDEALAREKQAGQRLTDFLVKRKRELEDNDGADKDDDKEEKGKDKKKAKKATNEEAQASATAAAVAAAAASAGHDTFDFSAVDPSLSGAASSSLWELAALQSHYSPQVSQLAALFLAENAPKRGLDVEAVIVNTGERLFKAEFERRKNQKTHLAYDKIEQFTPKTWKIR